MAKTTPIQYVSESVQELRKVTWPTQKQSIRLVSIVTVFCIIFAIILGFIDGIFNFLYSYLLTLA